MNIVSAGNQFQIYGESVKTYKELPVATYELKFSKMQGFFLTQRVDLCVKEDKVYGTHETKVEKILKSFDVSERNLGVILSGQKGIGKSLFVRVLANAAHNREKAFPVIIVSGYIPGLADFLSSIQQEVVVVFDEFEKTFQRTNDFDPQVELLPMFDGMDNGKKLFLVTCNEVGKLNSYLLNRPGRFHYHLVISNPTEVEIREYLKDSLKEEFYNEIENVVRFSHLVDVTFDYLRAIVFELNQGYTFSETMADLNIDCSSMVRFTMKVELTDGRIFSDGGIRLNIYSSNKECLTLFNRNKTSNNNDELNVVFSPSDIEVNANGLILNPEKLTMKFDSSNYWEDTYMTEEEAKDKKAHDLCQKVKSVKFEKQDRTSVFKYCV